MLPPGLIANDEVTAFHWADKADIRQFTRKGTTPAIRQHDGIEPFS